MKTSRRAHLAALLVLLLALACALGAAPAPAAAEDAPEATWSADEPPALSCTRALLVERETNTTLYAQGADERAYPASITKVMTALLVLENADLDDMVTVEEHDLDEVTWDSSVAGLKVGDTLSVRDLLACLLIPSGNDASYVLARYVAGGDWHDFVDMMNERAVELGCTGTHFVNPCGLHDDDHYSTAHDLLLMFEEALKHPEFAEIAGSATWDIPATGDNEARTLENTDTLLDPESPVYMGDAIVASKTGSTYDAGRCLITEAQRDGRTLIGVVLGAPMEEDADGVAGSFYDMRSLLEWGFGAWRTGDVVRIGDVVGEVGVTLSSDGEKVDAAATTTIYATVPADTTIDDLTLTPSWSGSIQAPVSEGRELGTVSVALGERRLGTVSAGVAHAMSLSIPAYVDWWVTNNPTLVMYAVAAVVALVLVVGLVAGVHAHVHRRRAADARRRGAGPSRRKATPAQRGRHGGSHLRR
ncbi:D-alanyl-D-alanine carboxypeptidase [Olsenella uli]|uniref:serine hydrolase n=1 Tax=Olsenella uli TaxID=133926 RepID=UPI00195BACC8|nr:D-alanyl-D-alanine carboxypeptidase [Olsenella uli]